MTKIAGSGSISQRHESADLDPDPDPPQNVTDPQPWFRNTAQCSPEFKCLVLRPLRLQQISGLTVDQLQLPHLLPANVQTCVQYLEIFITRIRKIERQNPKQ
jgi:hypothetical protein